MTKKKNHLKAKQKKNSTQSTVDYFPPSKGFSNKPDSIPAISNVRKDS